MSYVSLDKWIIHPPLPNKPEYSLSTGTSLNAAGIRHGVVFQVPQSGTLDTFELPLTITTLNGASALRFSFQDVDSNGLPDGSDDQYRDATPSTGSNVWTSPGLITNDGTNGGTKRTVTKGDWLACVLKFQTFTAADSLTARVRSNDLDGITDSVFMLSYNGASWAKSTTQLPFIALKYDSGYVALQPTSYHTIASSSTGVETNIETGTTPDELGNRFQLPFSCKVSGAWYTIDFESGTATGQIVLYDNASNVLASCNVTAKKTMTEGSGTTAFPGSCIFSSEIELTANTTYRLVVKGDNATQGAGLMGWDLPSNAYLAGSWGGSQWYSTSRTDGGSWTDLDSRQFQIGLLISSLEQGGGLLGGSGLNRGLN